MSKDRQYLDFIKTLPCILQFHHTCLGPVDPCHIKTRGAGGSDYQTFPACRKAHTEQHTIGILTFQEKYRVNLYEEALRCLIKWHEQDQTPSPATTE